jgi:hypothetical protein
MPGDKVLDFYTTLKTEGYDVPSDYNDFKSKLNDQRLQVIHSQLLKDGYSVPPDYSEFSAPLLGGSSLQKSFGQSASDAAVSQLTTPEQLQGVVAQPMYAGLVKPKEQFEQPRLQAVAPDPLQALVESQTTTGQVEQQEQPIEVKPGDVLKSYLSPPSMGDVTSIEPVAENAYRQMSTADFSSDMYDPNKYAEASSSLAFGSGKPYGSVVAESLAKKAAQDEGVYQREVERMRSGLDQNKQMEVVFGAIGEKYDSVLSDLALADNKGYKQAYESVLPGFKDMVTKSIGSELSSRLEPLKASLVEKYRGLVSSGMDKAVASEAMAKEYSDLSSPILASVASSYSAKNDALMAEYLKGVDPSVAEMALKYNSILTEKANLSRAYDEALKDYPGYEAKAKEQAVYEAAYDENPALYSLRETVAAPVQSVLETLRGLADVTGLVGPAMLYLPPPLKAAYLANLASEKLTGKELVSGKRYGYYDQLQDKVGSVIESATPMTSSRGIENPDGTINYSQLAPKTARTAMDMFLLIGGGEAGAGLARSANVAEKTAQDFGLFMSSFVMTKGQYKADAMKSGMGEAEAERYSDAAAGITSMLELVSPNKGVRDLMVSKPAREAMLKEAVSKARELTVKDVYEGAVGVLGEIGQENVQEITQNLGDALVNSLTNKFMGLESKGGGLNVPLTDADFKETIALTSLATLGMAGGAKVSNSIADRNAAMYNLATNQQESKKVLDSMLESGQISKVDYDSITGKINDFNDKVVGKMTSLLPPEVKGRLVDPMARKAGLVDELKSADESMKPLVQEKIDEVDQEIKGIINAVTTVKNAEGTGTQVEEGSPEETPDQGEGGGLRVRDAQEVGVEAEEGNAKDGEGVTPGAVQPGEGVLPVETVDKLRTKGETPVLEGLGEAVKEGSIEPVKVVYYPSEGKAVLEDGHHRLDESKRQGLGSVPVEVSVSSEAAPAKAVPVSPSDLDVNAVQPRGDVVEDAGSLRDTWDSVKAGMYKESPKGSRKVVTGKEVANRRKAISSFLKDNARLINRLGMPLKEVLLRRLNAANTDAKVEKWVSDFEGMVASFAVDKAKAVEQAKSNNLFNKLTRLVDPRSYAKREGAKQKNRKLTAADFDVVNLLNKAFNVHGSVEKLSGMGSIDDVARAFNEYQGRIESVNKEAEALSSVDEAVPGMVSALVNAENLTLDELEELVSNVEDFARTGKSVRKAMNEERAANLEKDKQAVLKANDDFGVNADQVMHDRNVREESYTYDTAEEASAMAEVFDLEGYHGVNGRFRPGDEVSFNEMVSRDIEKKNNRSDAIAYREREMTRVAKSLLMRVRKFNQWRVGVKAPFNYMVRQLNWSLDRKALDFLVEKYNRAVDKQVELRRKWGILKFEREVVQGAFGKGQSSKLWKYQVPGQLVLNLVREEKRPNPNYDPSVPGSKKERVVPVNENKSYTLMESAYIYMMARDPDVAERLRAQGFNDVAMEQVRRAVEGDENLMKFVGLTDELMSEIYQSVNAVHRDMYGMNMQKRQHYIPIMSDAWAQGDVDVDVTDFKKKPTDVWFGNIIERKGGKQNLITTNRNPIDVVMNYVEGASHFVAFARAASDLTKVLRDKEVVNSISENNGRFANRVLDMFLERMRSGGYEKSMTEGQYNKFRKLLSLTALGGKFAAQFIKQMTGFVRFASENPVEWSKGVMGFVTAPLKKEEREQISSLWKHPILKDRIERSGIDRDLVMNRFDRYRGRLSRAKTSVENLLMFTTKFGDVSAIIVGAYPYYVSRREKLRKENPSWSEADVRRRAMENTVDKVKALNPTSYAGDMTALQSDNFGKLITMFRADAIKMSADVDDAIHDLVVTLRKGGKVDYSALSRIIVNRSLATALFSLAAGSFGAFKGLGEGRDKEDEEAVDDVLWAALYGNMDANGIMGQLIKEAIDVYRGAPTDEGKVQVFSQGFESVKEAVKLLNKFQDGNEVAFEDAVPLMLKSISMGGVPVKTMQGYYDDIVEASNGEIKPWAFMGYTKRQRQQGESRERKGITSKVKDALLGDEGSDLQGEWYVEPPSSMDGMDEWEEEFDEAQGTIESLGEDIKEGDGVDEGEKK